jgi:hypothetical protein
MLRKFSIVCLVASSIAFIACASKGVDGVSHYTPDAGNDGPNPSSTDDASAGVVDATVTTASDDASAVDASADISVDSGPMTQAQCLGACQAQYPVAQAQSDAFDKSCMFGVCKPVCDNLMATGKDYPPDLDGSVFPIPANDDAGLVDAGTVQTFVCDTNAGMSFQISTPSVLCSDCISNTKTCCDQWIALFSSVQGQALNACANTCFANFK